MPQLCIYTRSARLYNKKTLDNISALNLEDEAFHESKNFFLEIGGPKSKELKVENGAVQ